MQIRVVENKQIKHMAIVFYQKDATVYAVHYKESENPLDVSKLEWLFSGAKKVQSDSLESFFVGYTFPSKLIKKFGINNLRLYANIDRKSVV